MISCTSRPSQALYILVARGGCDGARLKLLAPILCAGGANKWVTDCLKFETNLPHRWSFNEQANETIFSGRSPMLQALSLD